MTEGDKTDIITIAELAKILKIGKNRAYKLLESQEIKAFRIGCTWKIPRTSVERYIKDKTNSVE